MVTAEADEAESAADQMHVQRLIQRNGFFFTLMMLLGEWWRNGRRTAPEETSDRALIKEINPISLGFADRATEEAYLPAQFTASFRLVIGVITMLNSLVIVIMFLGGRNHKGRFHTSSFTGFFLLATVGLGSIRTVLHFRTESSMLRTSDVKSSNCIRLAS